MSATIRLEVALDVRYPQPVDHGHHEVRTLPASTGAQTPRRTSFVAEPSGWSAAHRDHWGTHVTALEVDGRHDRLTVTSTSVVDVDRAAATLPGGSWEDVRRAARSEGAEHLAAHPASPPLEGLATSARAMLFDGAAPDDVALAVCALVRSRVAWDGAGLRAAPAAVAPGSATTAGAWARRAGDSGDLTHLALSALRALGLPARAVVGIVHPDPAGEGRSRGGVVSAGRHAWVEWFSGAWFGFDVARGEAAGDLHVAVGHGRAVSDVPFLRGVASSASAGEEDAGGERGAAAVELTATMTRLT